MKGIICINKSANAFELIIGTIYIFSLILFAVGMSTHGSQYDQAIDPVDACYSPFSSKHFLTLIFYFCAFHLSMLLVWVHKNNLPPLTLTIALIFILIGVLLNLEILNQISVHDTESLNKYDSSEEQIKFLFAPLLGILIGLWLIYQSITEEITETFDRTYSNKYLNTLHKFLAKNSRNPFWIILLLFPLFFIVTLILILFGQDIDSIVKVFTDTTTWHLSQQDHPPILDHRGHYLCTVAATGNPKIVKPLRMGQRNGRRIIVNRQLLIANAFEEMIQDFSPKLQQIIRKNYDKYGYNLSQKINTVHLSNMTYVLMKPLEWFFLICLYLFCVRPETKINRQYAADKLLHSSHHY